jgi:hypothetical protein
MLARKQAASSSFGGKDKVWPAKTPCKIRTAIAPKPNKSCRKTYINILAANYVY